jgi:hypothetical protein
MFESNRARTTQKTKYVFYSRVLEYSLASITGSVPFMFPGKKICTVLLTMPCTGNFHGRQGIFAVDHTVLQSTSSVRSCHTHIYNNFLRNFRIRSSTPWPFLFFRWPYSNEYFTSVLCVSVPVSDSWHFGVDPDSRPVPYHWLSRCKQKISFFLNFFCLLPVPVLIVGIFLHHSSKITTVPVP